MFGILKLLGIFSLSQIRSVYDNYKINKYTQSQEYFVLKEKYDFLHKPLPQMKGYNRVLEFDVAHKKVRDIFPLLDKECIEKNILDGKHYGYAVRCAQNKWLESNEPDFYKHGYTFQQYVIEYARKTAYNNGYMPCCQRIGMARNAMYDTLYNGKIPNNTYKINFISGIPDQTERERLKKLDILYKYNYKFEN